MIFNISTEIFKVTNIKYSFYFAVSMIIFYKFQSFWKFLFELNLYSS